MSTNFINENIGFILTGTASIVQGIWLYFTSKKKKALEDSLLAVQVKLQEKEVEGNALDVTAKNMKLYQDMMDDIKIRFEATIEEYRQDVDRLKLLLEESRDTIGRQEMFLKEKNEELDRLRGILVENSIEFETHE